jgi:GTP cyclohydrolase I
MDPDKVMQMMHPGWRPRSRQELVEAQRVEVLHGGITTRSADYVQVKDEPETIIHGEMMELLQHITGVNFGAEGNEHMHDTPRRFVQMLRDLTTPEEFEFTTFVNDEGIDEMVSLTKIPFYTLCAHHIIPFYGYAHIGYVPGNSIAGLSKFSRTVRHFSRQLTVQEVMTTQIADFLEAKLKPQGVIVVLEAEHLCMAMRGVGTPGVLTRTTAVRGVFADHSRTAKAEFMNALNGHGG